MEEKWYDDLSEDAFLKEEDKEYKKAIEKIKDTVEAGAGFDEACRSVSMPDNESKKLFIEDALKVLIAEMHFVKKMPIEKIAEILKLPTERISSAKENMLKDVEDTAIKEFHKNTGNINPKRFS